MKGFGRPEWRKPIEGRDSMASSVLDCAGSWMRAPTVCDRSSTPGRSRPQLPSWALRPPARRPPVYDKPMLAGLGCGVPMAS